MPKFLTDSEYKTLKTRAENYDTVVKAIIESNEGIKAEDVTPELITQALTTERGDQQLQTAHEKLQKEFNQLQSRNKELEEQNQNLLNSASDTPGKIISEGGEPTGNPVSLTDFANQNTDDPVAIIEQCKKEGFI